MSVLVAVLPIDQSRNDDRPLGWQCFPTHIHTRPKDVDATNSAQSSFSKHRGIHFLIPERESYVTISGDIQLMRRPAVDMPPGHRDIDQTVHIRAASATERTTGDAGRLAIKGRLVSSTGINPLSLSPQPLCAALRQAGWSNEA